MTINCGDALHIHGAGEDGQQESWYAVAKQEPHEGSVDVEYLKLNPATRVWAFDGDVYECPVASIAAHAPYDEARGPQYAWAELGFRMLGPSSFVREDEEQDVPIGDAAFEVVSSDDDDEPTAEDLDFVVPDDQVEPWTMADPEDNEFVQVTHAAVRAYKHWVPKNDHEAGVKAVIDRLEHRAAHMDDDRRMATGAAPVNYTNPVA